MRRITSSHAALALAAVALFVALGGPAWAAGVLVGPKQLENGAVTSKKIKRGAVHKSDLAKGAVTTSRLGAKAVITRKLGDGSVKTTKLGDGSVTTPKLGDGSVSTTKLGDGSVTNGKLADNAVTSSKVADASLTATDVAPNTFLAANGTAANAQALGGLAPSDYAQLRSKRLTVLFNTGPQTLFAIPTGFVRASCPAGKPAMTYDNASTPVDYGEQDTSGTNTHFTTINSGLVNNADTVTSTTGLLRVTFQVGSRFDLRMSTVVVTGHLEGVTCIFTAQAVSTG